MRTICLFSGLMFAAFSAKADVYTFNVDHCSSPCGTGIGTVTVTQDGINKVLIDVESAGTGFSFVKSAGGGDEFFFNIQAVSGGNVDNPTIALSHLTAGWTLESTTAGSFGGAGWTFEYALTCLSANVCQHGASDPKAPPLMFDVTATGLSPASFDEAGGGTTPPAEFAADVIGTATGKTGLVGATLTSVTTTSTVPEPTSILLLITVVALILVPLKRRFAA